MNILDTMKVVDILKRINIKYKDKGDYYLVNCIYHNDKNPSLSIRDNGFFKCFSCGEKGYITKFYKDYTGRSIIKELDIAYSYLDDCYNKKSIEYSLEDSYTQRLSQDILVKGNFLNVYENKKVIEFLYKFGFEDKFINDFNVSYCNYAVINNTNFYDRVIIPIVENKKIICYEGRDYTGLQKPKLLYPKNSVKSTLFNIDNLDKNKKLIVVEGIKGLAKLYSLGFNVTCTLGACISKRQYELLNEFKDVTLFIDNDKAGWKMLDEFDKYYSYDFSFTYALEEGLDPNDLSKRQLICRLRDSQSYLKYLVSNKTLNNRKNNYDW